MRDIHNKIQKLLNMTNASLKLMKDITGILLYVNPCNAYNDNNTSHVNEIVQTASKEKSRVLKYLEQ